MSTDTISVAELLDEWYAFKKADLQPTTQATTATAMRALKRDFGGCTVDSVKPRHIDQWAARMRGEGYKPGSIRRRAGVLSAAYTCGVRWELCESNPFSSAS